jgi:hypothetical protein
MAEAIDAHVAAVFERAAKDSKDPETSIAWRDKLAGAVTEAEAKRQAAHADLIARYRKLYGEENVPLTELPNDLVRDMLADQHHRTLTLADAHVFPPGITQPVKPGHVRVALHQIAAWWLVVPSDPTTTSVSISYPPVA